MKPLIIFDMDGVLIDSEPVHAALEQKIFADLGLRICAAEHSEFVGMSPRGMWAKIRERHGLARSVDALVRAETKIKIREFAGMRLHAMPGVKRLLRLLSHSGHVLAVASSSPGELIEGITRKLGFRSLFAQVVSAEEVAYGKPAPDVFVRAAQLCGRPPADCVVIEDSANGVRGAIAAQMRCIGLRARACSNQDLTDSDLLVEDFSAASIGHIVKFLAGADT